jgi:hypothetical protein
VVSAPLVAAKYKCPIEVTPGEAAAAAARSSDFFNLDGEAVKFSRLWRNPAAKTPSGAHETRNLREVIVPNRTL